MVSVPIWNLICQEIVNEGPPTRNKTHEVFHKPEKTSKHKPILAFRSFIGATIWHPHCFYLLKTQARPRGQNVNKTTRTQVDVSDFLPAGALPNLNGLPLKPLRRKISF